MGTAMEEDDATQNHPESKWPGFQKLTSAQELLDQNKLLITEINQNHELKTPEALTRNAVLIKQLNNNVSRVVALYAELAAEVGVQEEPAAPVAQAVQPMSTLQQAPGAHSA